MQIQPDYSHQLEEIAKALNRSSIPQWVVALISVLLGALLGIMARQWLMNVIDNRRNIGAADETAPQVEMRRVLYLDLIRIFQRIDETMNGGTLRVPNQFWITTGAA